MKAKAILSLTGATMALAMAISLAACSDEPSNFDNDFYNELASGEKDYVCSAWFGSVYVKENGSDIWTNTEQDYETDLRKKGTIYLSAPLEKIAKQYIRFKLTLR